jgi:exodeoxyribonuclease VII large subunit
MSQAEHYVFAHRSNLAEGNERQRHCRDSRRPSVPGAGSGRAVAGAGGVRYSNALSAARDVAEVPSSPMLDLLIAERPHPDALPVESLLPSLSVGEVTRRIKTTLEWDEILSDVWVRGEVTQLTRAASGHLYFTLKEGESVLRACMFRSDAWRAASVGAAPRAGDMVVAHGRISVYEKRGDYQLIVDDIKSSGVGALHLEFAALKERLTAEGLFDAGRKRPLPFLPKRVGLVTSPAGAALQDMLRVLRERMPALRIVLIPALVQGPEAPESIAGALARANGRPDLDLVIVARGGGSLEDLAAFNTELVARSIRACLHPVVSAVGHETDFTIADMAADIRAATPTAAASIVCPDAAELLALVEDLTARLQRSARSGIGLARERLHAVASRPALARPELLSARPRERLAMLDQELEAAMTRRLERTWSLLQATMGRLNALSPLAVLERGYASIWRDRDGAPVRQASDAPPGEVVRIQLATDGITAQVLPSGEETAP